MATAVRTATSEETVGSETVEVSCVGCLFILENISTLLIR